MSATSGEAPSGVAASGEGAPVSDRAPRVLLTVEAAADQLSISRTLMYALLKSNEVISVRVGRLRRIPVVELEAYARRLVAKQHAA